jgi:hypothetical protein
MKTIKQFAELVQQQTKEKYLKEYPLKGKNIDPAKFWEKDYTVKVIEGKKYTKVDVGSSGKFMIDENGNIFGIKAYGVVHKGHNYGNLDTLNQYYWGNYFPERI